MKMRLAVVLCCVLSCLGLSGTGRADPLPKIRLLFAGEQAVVVLDDHPAVRDFLAMLPLSVTFEDFNGVEKIGYLPRKLHTEGSPSHCDPAVGTFAYYAPWGNLAVFLQDFRPSNGLVPLGHVVSGLDRLAGRQEDFVVRLEIVPDAASPTEAEPRGSR